MMKYLGPWSILKRKMTCEALGGDASYFVLACLAQLRFDCRASIPQAPMFESKGVCKDCHALGP